MTIASVVSLAERPDLRTAMWAMASTWPEFLDHDPVAEVCYPRLPDVFPEHQLVALAADGAVVGRVNSVPFAWSGRAADLPDRGWDAVLEQSFADRAAGRPATAVSLLEAALVPAVRGTGQSSALLRAARRSARRLGLRDLVGPVRPTAKSAEPRVPMAAYAERARADGLPADPWLRTHARLGGHLVRVCPASMTVSGSLAEWRAWTGLAFDVSGPVLVPGALTPVHCSVEHDHAVYVEPNVWVRHALEPGATSRADAAARAVSRSTPSCA